MRPGCLTSSWWGSRGAGSDLSPGAGRVYVCSCVCVCVCVCVCERERERERERKRESERVRARTRVDLGSQSLLQKGPWNIPSLIAFVNSSLWGKGGRPGLKGVCRHPTGPSSPRWLLARRAALCLLPFCRGLGLEVGGGRGTAPWFSSLEAWLSTCWAPQHETRVLFFELSPSLKWLTF